MKASNERWKQRLAGKLPEALAREIDEFETEMERRLQGKGDEKIFAETRLRRGIYGQRYDNGQRHDGLTTRALPYPQGRPTKGPHTLWDAPGMQRIKIPYGGLSPAQLEALAEVAEEYADGIAHVTTRQDVQLHFVLLEDTPTLMRRLAAAGITTREACGNTVRNVTACPYAGVCPDEAFDVTPYARALSAFLLGHPDTQNFGRKFKPAFSGCAGHACGLAQMHDLGYTAAVRDGKRGFRMVVGGGLGTVPFQAKLFDGFLPPEELLPTAQAIARVFARHGEKKNRNRARMKFLVKDWGIERFRQEVLKERAALEPDPRWSAFCVEQEERPSRPAGPLKPSPWAASNVRPQRQAGYFTATIALPLGDLTAAQLRAVADLARRFAGGNVRTTVEQNLLLRWVSGADVAALEEALRAAGLAEPGAGGILDITACPGTDTCKLGISSSRGLAAELRRRLAEKSFQMDEAVRDLHIKISGCFNSCGQHHVADIGFYGVSRNLGNFKVPHFQVILGGRWEENAGAYGLPVVAIPSKRIPQALDRILEHYARGRTAGESFHGFITRSGKAAVREMLEDLAGDLPDHDQDPSFYSDWADPREYGTGDIGVGECAGEVVSAFEFDMGAAERKLFESQLALDGGDATKAGKGAVAAMLASAKALVKLRYDDVGNDPAEIVQEFRERYYDTQLFFDTYAGGKFAQSFFAAVEKAPAAHTAESAHHLIDEAQLFIDAVHACYGKVRDEAAAKAGKVV